MEVLAKHPKVVSFSAGEEIEKPTSESTEDKLYVYPPYSRIKVDPDLPLTTTVGYNNIYISDFAWLPKALKDKDPDVIKEFTLEEFQQIREKYMSGATPSTFFVFVVGENIRHYLKNPNGTYWGWLDEITKPDLKNAGFFGNVLDCLIITDYQLENKLTLNPNDIVVVNNQNNKILGYYRAEKALGHKELVALEKIAWGCSEEEPKIPILFKSSDTEWGPDALFSANATKDDWH